MNLDDNVSPHFKYREVIFSETAERNGIDNTLPDELMPNVQRQAQLMEDVRFAMGGRPIFITSWYRCPQLNAAIGGSSDHSAHMKGLACDFHCPDLGNPLEVARFISEAKTIQFDQLIYEGTWVHIGLGDGNRMQLLTARFPGPKWFQGLIEPPAEDAP